MTKLFAKGICLDDFEISAINWTDDTTTTGNWIPKGFTLVQATIPTDYLIQVIQKKGFQEIQWCTVSPSIKMLTELLN
ncbi:MAG: hypothetical protein CM1200mP39_01280 [Dehalococcoidia bacterium]|nr:MAG: hypothetical protein CM1200mP39_01280 [Dehalococcoidia bacterium]